MLDRPDEAPLAAGQHELAEETGFTARDWWLLASIPVNPANHDNLTHIVLATGAALTELPADDPHERVRAHLRPAAEVVALARSGGITQAMHVTGLALGLTELGLWGYGVKAPIRSLTPERGEDSAAYEHSELAQLGEGCSRPHPPLSNFT